MSARCCSPRPRRRTSTGRPPASPRTSPRSPSGRPTARRSSARSPAANVVNSYGGTPAATGIQTAYEHLQSLPPDVPRAMILVTDGAANCSQSAQTNQELFEVYDVALPSLVQTANGNGVKTYVVGIDIVNMVTNDGIGGDPNNINPFQKLNEVAQLGGTGSFFNSQDQAELAAALDAVIDSVKTCVIPLDEEPVFPNFTKVFVSGTEWPKVMNCGSEDGWVYVNPMGPYDAIQLCGAACDALKQAEQADVEYHCDPG
ncbi:MAG: VWA domain-containing protein [Deltaproteobacteria bacterium]|nr:VWA domain-containing protein [Deltaproteobacteria bacterium]